MELLFYKHFSSSSIVGVSEGAPVDPPQTENVGMCLDLLDNLPVRAGEGEVGIVPVLVELPHLGDHIRLVNTHPETQCLIIRCFLRISEYAKLVLIDLKVVTN